MSQQKKKQEAQTQKLEAECFSRILLKMYQSMLNPNRYMELWEEVRKTREVYLSELGKIK